MIYNLLLSDIGFSIRQALRTLCGRLAAVLYNFIVDLYDVFMYVARADILRDEVVQNIYNRVGMILGLFMIFKLMFSVIQSLMNPDMFSDKKSGFAAIIQRTVIAIVLLGITPTIFKEAFELQNLIVGSADDSDNIIYKLIVANESTEKASSFGSTIATDLFFSFYKERVPGNLSGDLEIIFPEPGKEDADQNGELDPPILQVYTYDVLKQNIRQRAVKDNGSRWNFDDAVDNLMLTDTSGNYLVVWDEVFSIGMAIVMIMLLVNYCIQVATRVVQLAYLQLIAPVPILSYISSPDGAFKSWLKQCTTTYLDLFLRLAIIYFVIMLSTMILNLFNVQSGTVIDGIPGLFKGSSSEVWVKLFLVVGLLMFGKRVPELLKELFPSTGGAAGLGFGMKGIGGLIKDIPGSGLVKGAATLGAGVAIGGVAGIATGIKYGKGTAGGRLGGAFTGFARGVTSARTKGNIFTNAGKGISSQRAAMYRAYDRNNDGSSFWGRTALGSYKASHDLESFDKELSAYDQFNNTASLLEKELSKNSMVQAAVAHRQALLERESRGGAAATSAEIDKANAAVKDANKRALAAAIYDFGSARENKTIKSILHSAEATRAKGQSKGYSGFGNVSFEDASLSSRDRADAFFDNKTSTTVEQNNIKNPGGSRNDAYKKAKANSGYKRK